MSSEKRFRINQTDLESFKSLRKKIENLMIEYPYLSGLGFFGSRVKGIAKPRSDYDVCIFYNSEKMSWDSGRPAEWIVIIQKLEATINTNFDHRILTSSDGLRINISEKRTTQVIEGYISMLKKAKERGLQDQELIAEMGQIPYTQDLFARFFLCVGNEVYKNRKFIVNYLQKVEDGNNYLGVLMKCLENFQNHKK